MLDPQRYAASAIPFAGQWDVAQKKFVPWHFATHSPPACDDPAMFHAWLHSAKGIARDRDIDIDPGNVVSPVICSCERIVTVEEWDTVYEAVQASLPGLVAMSQYRLLVNNWVPYGRDNILGEPEKFSEYCLRADLVLNMSTGKQQASTYARMEDGCDVAMVLLLEATAGLSEAAVAAAGVAAQAALGLTLNFKAENQIQRLTVADLNSATLSTRVRHVGPQLKIHA